MPSIVAADSRPVPALQQNCLDSNSGEKDIQEPVQTSKHQGLLPRSRLVETYFGGRERVVMKPAEVSARSRPLNGHLKALRHLLAWLCS